jgi:hypothetical protein
MSTRFPVLYKADSDFGAFRTGSVGGHAHQGKAGAPHKRHSVLSGMGSPELTDAIGDVSEGHCPLCHVTLITHDGGASLRIGLMPGSPSLFPVDHDLVYHDEQMALREAA